MPGVHSFKRCGCRDDASKVLDARCPQLRRKDGSWNPKHGTWFGRAALPDGADGKRQELRAGGWSKEAELHEWFAAALQLMEVPAAGPEGHDDRAQILALVRRSRRRGEPLPDIEHIRRRYSHGLALEAGSAGEYLTDWLAGLRRSKKVGENTLRGYESHVRLYFMPAFGTVPLDRLRVSHVSRAFDLIEERNAEIAAARASDDPDVVASVRGKRGTGPATQQRIRATLRAALAPAARSGLLAGNVAAQLEMAAGDRPKARPWTQARVDDWRKRYDAATEGMHGDRARWRVWRLASMRPSPVMVWTLPQIGQFLDHIADDWLYALYHLISYRGLRRGEACGLRWADVDLDGGKVTITAAIVQLGWTATESTLKSDASDGTIGLDAETVKVLKAWRKVQLAERVRWGAVWTDTGHVFTAEQGGPLHPDRITDVFEWAAFKAGLPPIRLHDLRHGAASIAHAAGADIKAISHLLRHSSIGITADTYMSVFEEADRELAESMSRMVPRARAVGDSERTDAPTTRPHLRPRDSGGIGG